MAPSKSKISILDRIAEEPFRLFFPLGILAAIVGVGHWPAYALGWLPHYSALFHSTVQSQSYLTCFVVGFLMTAMPRFAGAPHARKSEVMIFLLLILGNFAAASLARWLWAEICFAGVLFFLLIFAARRFLAKRESSVQPPLEFIWIPFALLHGLAGSFLFILTQLKKIPSNFFPTAKLLNEQGFILCIVIGIGGFLAPRLMGTFRVYTKSGQKPDDPALTAMRRKVLAGHFLAGIVFFSSFWIGRRNLSFSYGMRAFIITLEYLWTCSGLPLPKTPGFYVKLLWISLWMVLLGSWSAALFPPYRTAMLHLIFIGGFSLMIFAVATMVVLSHGGEPEKIHRPLAVLQIIAFGVAGSLGFRIAAAFYPYHYFPLLAAAGIFWILAAAAWFLFAAPKTFRTLSREETEECHEDAKQRIAQLRQSAKK